MPRHFCVYGHISGLDEHQLHACVSKLNAYECEISASALDFVHEGHFLDVESDLDALLSVLSPAVRGVIDIINHQDWEMHRCTLANGVLTRKRIFLDNALDTAYASERKIEPTSSPLES